MGAARPGAGDRSPGPGGRPRDDARLVAGTTTRSTGTYRPPSSSSRASCPCPDARTARRPGSRRRRSPRRRRADDDDGRAEHTRPGQTLRRPPAGRPRPPVSGDGPVRPAHRGVPAGADHGRRPALAVLRLAVLRDPYPGRGAGRGLGPRGVAPAARPPRTQRPGRPAARTDRARRPAADEHRRRLRDQRRRLRRRPGPPGGRCLPVDSAPAARRAHGGLPVPVPPRPAHPEPRLAGLRERRRRAGEGMGVGAGRRARAQRARTGRGPFPGGAGHHGPAGRRLERMEAVGGGGVPSSAALAGVAGSRRPLGRLGARRGGGLHLRPAVPSLHRPPRRRPAEPAPQTAPGLRRHRHLRFGQRRRTGQRPPGSRRHLPCGGRPPRPGHRPRLRRCDPGRPPAVPGRGHCAGGRWGHGSAYGLREGTAGAASARRDRRPHRRPDTVAFLATCVPDGHRTVSASARNALLRRGQPRLRPGRTTGVGAGGGDRTGGNGCRKFNGCQEWKKAG